MPGKVWRQRSEQKFKTAAKKQQAAPRDSERSQPAFFPTPDGAVKTFVDEAHLGWMLPLRQCVISEWPVDFEASKPAWISRDAYVQLVDSTGRMVREGKRGAISPQLAENLTRLDLEPERWLAAIAQGGTL